jgi:hypothetical protein
VPAKPSTRPIPSAAQTLLKLACLHAIVSVQLVHVLIIPIPFFALTEFRCIQCWWFSELTRLQIVSFQCRCEMRRNLQLCLLIRGPGRAEPDNGCGSPSPATGASKVDYRTCPFGMRHRTFPVGCGSYLAAGPNKGSGLGLVP